MSGPTFHDEGSHVARYRIEPPAPPGCGRFTELFINTVGVFGESEKQYP